MDPENDGAYETTAIRCFSCQDKQTMAHKIASEEQSDAYGLYYATLLREGGE